MRTILAQQRLHVAFRDSLGPVIQAALEDANIVEVMVNPGGRIWVDGIRGGRHDTGAVLPAGTVETIIRLVADHIGETATRESPLVAGTIPETGERFQGVLPPLSPAAAFTIRKRPGVIFSLDEYVQDGIMTATQVAIVRDAVTQRRNVLIAGGTGSGKTTLVNAILAEPGFAAERIVLIEDTAELQCAAPDQVRLLTRRTEPAVTIRELVKTTLRLRPDRIIIGETRDGAALDMLKAWNTGHPGGLSTVHANSAEDALYRLEELIGEVSVSVPRRAIAQGIHLVVFIERSPTTPAGRTVSAVARVVGLDGTRYVLAE
ncbi:MAG: P-type conjugative transfer ATPase TrbB [Rhodospirillales bacterium]|nr:MAG: P-type conjugative transfer ATPase TrbB [Rhodospirillales bacterium]